MVLCFSDIKYLLEEASVQCLDNKKPNVLLLLFLPHYTKSFSWAFTIFGTFPHHNRLIVSSIRSHFDFGLIIGISYKFWNSCWRSIVIFTFSFYLYIDISKESVLLFINGRSLLPKLSFRGMYSTKYIWS